MVRQQPKQEIYCKMINYYYDLKVDFFLDLELKMTCGFFQNIAAAAAVGDRGGVITRESL